jgi:hypothetical protein
LDRQGLQSFSEIELFGVELLKERLKNQKNYQNTLILIDQAEKAQKKREWTQNVVIVALFLLFIGGAYFFM